MKSLTYLTVVATLLFVRMAFGEPAGQNSQTFAYFSKAAALKVAESDLVLRTAWNGVVADQRSGSILHVADGANRIELHVVSRGGSAVSQAYWETRNGTIARTGNDSAVWFPDRSDSRNSTLEVSVVEGANLVAYRFPIRFHQYRFDYVQVGGLLRIGAGEPYMDFFDTALSGPASETAGEVGAGAFFAGVTRGQGPASVALSALPQPADQMLTISLAARVDAIEAGTEFALAISAGNQVVAKLAVRNDTGRLVKRITLGNGSSVEQNLDARWWPGREIFLTLAYNPVEGIVSGFDSWSFRTLETNLSLGGSMVTPVVSVMRREAGAVSVAFTSLWTSTQVIAYAVSELAPGTQCHLSLGLACRPLGNGGILIVQPFTMPLHEIELRSGVVLSEKIDWALNERVKRISLEAIKPFADSSAVLY